MPCWTRALPSGLRKLAAYTHSMDLHDRAIARCVHVYLAYEEELAMATAMAMAIQMTLRG